MLKNSPDYSVQFGQTIDKGLEGQRAFPFFYNFVNAVDDTWEAVKGPATAANLTGIGPAIPALGSVQHPIRLDPDYNYLLLWIRYTATWLDTVNGIYVWYEPVVGWFQEQGDYQSSIGTPLVASIDVSAFFLGSQTNYLYGGFNTNPLAGGGTGRLSLPIEAAQGYDCGMGQLRTPYLLPREGIVMLDIHNRHTVKTLVVGGCLYGLKIRL